MKPVTRSRRFGGSMGRKRLLTVSITVLTALFVACCLAVVVYRGGAVEDSLSSFLNSESAMPASSRASESKPVLDTLVETYAQPAAVHPVSGKPVKAKIITCPACRLNSLPKVKNFVKEQSQWFTPSLEVEYISGRDPHLFLFEDNKETGDIDLAELDEAAIMRRLVQHGIYPNKLTAEIRAAVPGYDNYKK